MEINQKNSFKTRLRYLWMRIKHLVLLDEDTDVEATIATITKGIEFKGATIWILVFAIIVASVGLNVNSTAVIIGAMLISPLMGPINGVGLALGISDTDLLKKSLFNLAIMVLISLITSFAYFLLSPLSDAQSELLARTRPTIFDVFIAFFGGLAGIVATSRKSQPFTVISGVAIATALMPPLCTAGYGLASGQFNYFLGAFYLFFINSFCIALSAFFLVKFLHFPQKKYIDPNGRKLVKRSITIFSIIVIIPSVFMAIDLVRESSFNSSTIQFVNAIQDTPYFDDTQLVNYKKSYSRKEQVVTLSLVGKELSAKDISKLQNMLTNNYGLKNAKLVVKQTGGVVDLSVQTGLLEKILDNKDMQLAAKDSIIDVLEHEIDQFANHAHVNSQLAKEIAVQYPKVEYYSIANTVYINPRTQMSDTIPTLFVTWSGEIDPVIQNQLVDWLKVRLNYKQLKVIN